MKNLPNLRKTSECPLSFRTEFIAFLNAQTTTIARATAGSPVALDLRTPIRSFELSVSTNFIRKSIGMSLAPGGL